ncbi:MAG: hypothetical protein ABL908_05435, partial [Hyphomicrobium sp.]
MGRAEVEHGRKFAPHDRQPFGEVLGDPIEKKAMRGGTRSGTVPPPCDERAVKNDRCVSNLFRHGSLAPSAIGRLRGGPTS